MCFKFVDSFASPLLCTKSFRFEVLAGGVGVGVFVVAESDGDAVGGAWGGPVGEFASEVLTHLADGQGCEVGEDLSAGGGGVVEQGQEEVVGADFLVAEQGGLAQAALEDLLRSRRWPGCPRPPGRSPPGLTPSEFALRGRLGSPHEGDW